MFSSIERLRHIVLGWEDGDCILTGMEYAVFEQDMSHFYLFKEDILEFVRMERIGAGVVPYYMRDIYN